MAVLNMSASIAVVLPCFRVGNIVLDVIANIGPEVSHIIVVDDACPDGSGKLVQKNVSDPRVEVVFREQNGGVGAAVVSGYRRALELGAGIVVKLDGDGQMDPALIPDLVGPIQSGFCDYAKGNRFFNLAFLSEMPGMRLFGNSCLSLLNKIASGYWNVMDPTNGFVAIEGRVLALLPLEKLEPRYFFESDMLYRLGTVRAVVADVPMVARYGDEVSNLSIRKVLLQFPGKLFVRFLKRLFYTYFLRDFNAGSLFFVMSLPLVAFSLVYGSHAWYSGFVSGQASAPGVVMLAALPFLIGMHLLVSAINWDISNIPRQPLHPFLRSLRAQKGSGNGA